MISRIWNLIPTALLTFCFSPLAWSTDTASPEIGDVIAPFELDSWTGKTVSWPSVEDSELLLIVFTGTECPLAKLYAPKLNQIQEEYGPGKVTVIAVDSNQQDSLLEMGAFARRQSLEFEFVKDPANRIADRMGATRTPEVFLLDSERKLRYRGRIDDQYGVGYGRAKATASPLRDAIESVLQGQPVEVTTTEPVGCLIGRVSEPVEDPAITFSTHIAPLLQKHCVECHRDGEIGPMSFEKFEDVAGWSEMIEEVIRDGRMPPWSAEPGVGDFGNERGMADAEKEQFYRWVADGAPLGDEAETRETKTYVTGWQLDREPDVVIEMSDRPFEVQAEGVVEYTYFIVDPGFEEDRWVNIAQVVPGDSSVVHHAIVFYRAPDAQGDDNLGWISAYVPGQRIHALALGMARRIPAGSRLIFQMHYTPNGRKTLDKTKIGLCFVDEADVKREVLTVPAINRNFEIPPNHANYPVETTLRGLPVGSTLLSVAPHMHYRGKSFELTVAESPDQKAESLLNIPLYDFNWQHTYRFAEPMELNPNTEFRCLFHFDNSDQNLSNPNPNERVSWGDQTWEEMAVTFFDIALPEGQTAAELSLQRNQEVVDRNKQAIATAERYIKRFDTNNDRKLRRNEVPESFATFAFHRYDGDNDQVITEGEIVKYILSQE